LQVAKATFLPPGAEFLTKCWSVHWSQTTAGTRSVFVVAALLPEGEDHAPLDEGEVSLGGVEKGEAGVAAPAGSPPTAAAWPPTAAPIYAVRRRRDASFRRRAKSCLLVGSLRKKKEEKVVWLFGEEERRKVVWLFGCFKEEGLFAKSCLSVGLSAKS